MDKIELKRLLRKAYPDEDKIKLENKANSVLTVFGEELDNFELYSAQLQDDIIQCLVAIREG